MSASTLPLTVANTGFLLDRLGEDCHPLQFLRELTQNSIEAIKRAGERNGKILWDVDWTIHDLDGGPLKLSITDNGDGMTGPEMIRYINQLSSSGSAQRFDGNYGVGAKIAAATRNHHGLLYLSWKEGSGSSVHMWRDPMSGQYGLRQFERPDGSFGHFAELDDDVKPEMLKSHGTRITLLGKTAEENTMLAPDICSARDRWILKYLNTRYFRIPDGITITAREGLQTPKGRERGLLRNVYGQSAFLSESAVRNGTVQLRGGRAHWWIVKEQKELVTEGPSYETTGHVAALYQDELYEMTTGRSGRAVLQQFGIIFGSSRVVIYVEPSHGKLTTNTARTRLIVDGDDLPWGEWASEFRQKMPLELKTFMEEVGSKALATDDAKTIRERLKPILDLYRVSRYRLCKDGPQSLDDANLTVGNASAVTGTGPGSRKGTKRGRIAGAAAGPVGGVYGAFLKNDGVAATRIEPDVFPKVVWVSVKDGSRTEGDIEDRAARYLAGENQILINGDFRVFNDLINRWAGEFDGTPAARAVCERVIRSWFEQTLVEAVIGVQCLKDSREWSCEDINRALSEDALTTAVMPRYFINYAAKREIGTKLGRLG